MKNAGIYVRVSTERQVQEGYSISAQKNNLIKFANDNHLFIYDIYADEGISGKNVINRPEVQRLINDIQNSKIDVVLIQKFDRLTRNISDTEDFIELFKKHDIDVWSISDGKVDFNSSNGKFMTLLKGLFAQHEREQIADRIKIAFREKAKEGYTLCSGCPPYGYKHVKGNKVLQIKEDEAKIVRRIYEMYLNNMSLSMIAKTLNIEGIPTKKKGKIINLKKNGLCLEKHFIIGRWTSKTIRLILSNPVYIGKVKHYEYLGDGLHEKIISTNLWKSVRDKDVKIKKVVRTKRSHDDVYYCGTLVCGICNHMLTTKRTIKNGKNYNSYRCINHEKGICDSHGISHEKVEKAFREYIVLHEEQFKKIRKNMWKKEKENYDEIVDIKRIITNATIKLKEIMQMFIDNSITKEQVNYMSKELKERISIYENKLLKTKKDKEFKSNDKMFFPSSFNDYWKLMNDAEKLAFLTDFVEKIVIVNSDKKGKVKILEVKFYDEKASSKS